MAWEATGGSGGYYGSTKQAQDKLESLREKKEEIDYSILEEPPAEPWTSPTTQWTKNLDKEAYQQYLNEGYNARDAEAKATSWSKVKGTEWGAPSYYSNLGISSDAQNVANARARQQAYEKMYQSGLGMLQSRAQGQDLISRKQAYDALARGQAGIQSQLASAQGGYNPAAQRAAMYAQAGLGQDIAGQTAIAAAQEQQAAQDAYLQALSTGQTQALQAQQVEQNWEAMINDSKQKWMALGLSDKEAERNARMQAYLAEKQQAYMAQQLAAAQAAQDANMFASLLSAGMGAVGTIFGGPAGGAAAAGATKAITS